MKWNQILGGLQNAKQKIGHIPLLKLGGNENTDVGTSIEQTASKPIGKGFYNQFTLQEQQERQLQN